ncbi:tyrosine-type recombinase/integrase [Salinibacillus xinjiangensis]|uniref:Tyrosine-type recombinase/integrase n=1 Tax=Salinibacillus xinjiangensis TaxID=1229268 RepID=A0A6G1X7B5_9BACI|nr:tyrosine-type recombinase/integrase [Salinibacillus xinjiangensis]MRG86698.1 tyrosine-type recombinase/integrase [Salinibacillus xinjiangensis]
MASYQKRGNKWQYTISRGKEKPIRKGGFSKKAEAVAAATEMEAKIFRGIVPHLTPVPIDEYFDNWVELYKKNSSDATLRHYRYTSERIKEHFGSKPLQDITANDYQEFLNEFGSNKSKESVSKLHGHIRACVQDAKDEHIVPRDFTRKAQLHYTVSAKRNKDKHLNLLDSELLFKTLLSKLNNSDLGYHLLLLDLETGLRFEELVGLTFGDFDFKNNTVNVDKVWGYTNRMKRGFGLTKGNKDRSINSDRVIYVTKELMDVFKELFKIIPDNKNHLVFYNAKSQYKVITNNHANDLLKEVLLELQIKPLISVHGLRHTHGSVLLHKGTTLQYVSERLGHLDIETTYRKYIHLTKEGREADKKITIKTFEDMYNKD